MEAVTESSPNQEGTATAVGARKNFCFYCGVGQSKLARHLQRKHAAESDVALALSEPRGTERRRKIFSYLLSRGNYDHDSRTRNEVSAAAQAAEAEAEAGAEAEAEAEAGAEAEAEAEAGAEAEAEARGPPATHTTDGCEDIVLRMRSDDISGQVRSDTLICQYGQTLFELHGQDRTQHNYISQKMRELGRLMLEVKRLNPAVPLLVDLCVPNHFQLAVSAAREACGFDPTQGKYSTPSLACKIGYALKKVCKLLIAQSLVNGQREAGRQAEDFVRLLDTDWNRFVSKRARTDLEQAKWNRSDVLPLTGDVLKLQTHLAALEEASRLRLAEGPDPFAWRNLSESALAQIILFNRRREGEAAKMLLETYQNRNTAALSPEVYESLSDLERDLSKRFTRVEIRGKRGRKVPVLLTDRMCSALDLLIRQRSRVGVPATNPYMFARIEAATHVRGSDCLRKFAAACGAQFPSHLTSTKLRKQVATLCQVMNLKDNEMDQLANFMGHDIRVHREYYRLPENTLQLTKMSKLLLAIEQGATSFKGKSLDEIDLNLEDVRLGPPPARHPRLDHGTSSVPEGESDPAEGTSRTAFPDTVNDPLTTRSPTGPKVTEPPREPPDSAPSGRTQGHPSSDGCSSWRKRTPWSQGEKDAVWRHFSGHLERGTVPGKKGCERCLTSESDLRRRSWRDIKHFVHNRIRAKRQRESHAHV